MANGDLVLGNQSGTTKTFSRTLLLTANTSEAIGLVGNSSSSISIASDGTITQTTASGKAWTVNGASSSLLSLTTAGAVTITPATGRNVTVTAGALLVQDSDLEGSNNPGLAFAGETDFGFIRTLAHQLTIIDTGSYYFTFRTNINGLTLGFNLPLAFSATHADRAQDVFLSRLGAGSLGCDSDFSITTAGKGFRVKEGANAKMGVGTLSSGTATITTTAVTANSRIFLSDQGGGVFANIGSLSVGTVVPGTSFVVNSSNITDSSNFAWVIFEPA
jgi:hypothetical protein